MSLLSPGIKSIAEMAGWDEEALLLAIVEDTPIRDAKKKKRSDLNIKSPHSSSRTKRRAKRRNPGSISISAFNLDDVDSVNNNDKGNDKKLECVKSDSKQKVETDEGKSDEGTSAASSSSTALPCMDRLREELSCAICLEICFEPSTTPCGHSFCKKCLRSAADRCGKRCPKCRQLISNGRSCTVNTVLWNTIQLLFPGEVEARKAAGALNGREAESRSPEKTSQPNNNVHLTRRLRPVITRRNNRSTSSRADDTDMSGREDGSRNRGRGVVSTQDEDAALALRLQREEVMRIYRGSNLARDNLRAMAQRAVNLRVRYRAV